MENKPYVPPDKRRILPPLPEVEVRRHRITDIDVPFLYALVWILKVVVPAWLILEALGWFIKLTFWGWIFSNAVDQAESWKQSSRQFPTVPPLNIPKR